MQNGYEPPTVAADESQVETWLAAFGAGLCNHVTFSQLAMRSTKGQCFTTWITWQVLVKAPLKTRLLCLPDFQYSWLIQLTNHLLWEGSGVSEEMSGGAPKAPPLCHWQHGIHSMENNLFSEHGPVTPFICQGMFFKDSFHLFSKFFVCILDSNSK